MQSIIQHRRFKTKLEAQLGRNPGTDDSHPLPLSTERKDIVDSDASGEWDLGVEAYTAGEPAEQQGSAKDDEKLSERDGSSTNSTERTSSPVKVAEEDQDRSPPNALERMNTSLSNGVRLGRSLTGISLRKRHTREGQSSNVFVVGYEGPNDSMDPHNWPYSKRLYITFLVAFVAWVVSMASAIDSSVIKQAAAEFGVNEVVESMATGLFLIAFGFGALFAGPVSETLGRNPVYISTMAVYMIFIMASALAPNIGAQLVFRFIAGFFGSTPLTCAGGTLSDIWDPTQRIWAFSIFASFAFLGPLFGPAMAGWIGQSSAVSWRWTEWATLIASGLILGLLVLTNPETHKPTLLRWKAGHLRQLTGDQRYVSEMEITQEPFFVRLRRALWRPFVLTVYEPVIVLMTLYMTVVYIVLFTFLIGYDFVFGETYGVSQGITGTCFLGIAIGVVLSLVLVPWIYREGRRELQAIQEQGGEPRLAPEFRLWYTMLGGALAIPVSLFWMGWTARADISIWSPLAASVLFGYGIMCVFITCYQYIIDMYEIYAASALTSMTLIWYLAAGGMTIAGLPFYQNMGVAYTLTIMACISAALVPVPYLLYFYGPWIRSKSRFAAKH